MTVVAVRGEHQGDSGDQTAKVVPLPGSLTTEILLPCRITGICAARDIARWPDQRTGGNIRVKHGGSRAPSVVAARNIVAMERFAAAPVFWSRHIGKFAEEKPGLKNQGSSV
ncbi:MAG TPA: hypothetical protein VJ692_08485 [Nitrospiraceae bacterium]|nr:hypothetical protein [Nitrospiraceae bacterium]